MTNLEEYEKLRLSLKGASMPPLDEVYNEQQRIISTVEEMVRLADNAKRTGSVGIYLPGWERRFQQCRRCIRDLVDVDAETDPAKAWSEIRRLIGGL